MAIQINGNPVITNTPNIVNVNNGDFAGIVTATKFVGDGSALTNLLVTNELDAALFS